MLPLPYINLKYLFALVYLLLLLHAFLYVTFQNLLKSSENLKHRFFDDFRESRR